MSRFAFVYEDPEYDDYVDDWVDEVEVPEDETQKEVDSN